MKKRVYGIERLSKLKLTNLTIVQYATTDLLVDVLEYFDFYFVLLSDYNCRQALKNAFNCELINVIIALAK